MLDAPIRSQLFSALFPTPPVQLLSTRVNTAMDWTQLDWGSKYELYISSVAGSSRFQLEKRPSQKEKMLRRKEVGICLGKCKSRICETVTAWQKCPILRIRKPEFEVPCIVGAKWTCWLGSISNSIGLRSTRMPCEQNWQSIPAKVCSRSTSTTQ